MKTKREMDRWTDLTSNRVHVTDRALSLPLDLWSSPVLIRSGSFFQSLENSADHTTCVTIKQEDGRMQNNNTAQNKELCNHALCRVSSCVLGHWKQWSQHQHRDMRPRLERVPTDQTHRNCHMKAGRLFEPRTFSIMMRMMMMITSRVWIHRCRFLQALKWNWFLFVWWNADWEVQQAEERTTTAVFVHKSIEVRLTCWHQTCLGGSENNQNFRETLNVSKWPAVSNNNSLKQLYLFLTIRDDDSLYPWACFLKSTKSTAP